MNLPRGLLVVLTACLICCGSGSAPAQDKAARTLADQPLEQQVAVRRILELGGDWESATKTVLIGLMGEKCDNATFKLLTPLVDLKHLYFSDLPADDDAFVHCKSLRNVETVQICSCKFTGEGLKQLSGCKKLRTLWINDVPVTDRGAVQIAQLETLESLEINNIETPPAITADGVRSLTRLKQLKKLYVTLIEFPDGLKAELQQQLPQCEIGLNKYRN